MASYFARHILASLLKRRRRIFIFFLLTSVIGCAYLYRLYYLLNPVYPSRKPCTLTRPRIRWHQLASCQFNNQLEELLSLHYGSHVLGRALEYTTLKRQQILPLNTRVPFTEFFHFNPEESCEVAPFPYFWPERQQEAQYDVVHGYYDEDSRLEKWQNFIQGREADGRPLYMEQRVFDWSYLPHPSFQQIIPDFIDYLKHNLHLGFHHRITLPQIVAHGGPYLAAHFRRGDFEGHCQEIAEKNKPPVYMSTYSMRHDPSWPATSREDIIAACWPTPFHLSRRITKAAKEYGVKRVYILHNASAAELGVLQRLLRAEGLEVRDSTEVKVPVWDQVEMSIATDMLIGTRAKVFLGNRWSSVGSNIALMRHVEGMENGTYFH